MCACVHVCVYARARARACVCVTTQIRMLKLPKCQNRYIIKEQVIKQFKKDMTI